ncbi:MAG: hypothetical protein CO047_05455 [Piscirickettsiaceae bacterium CG_4_9_14_0_2_um_filter_44_546]|nr:hypothetical protein [Thiomicrospira sp.]NCO82304.1 hypothetical protein [Thiomicrospira sp.]NCS64062.1 hypothetical protein [Thiomicrospira sp.]PIY77168.1 MAG: hypothetical protein COY84_02120 [Piscirickettsiaceae bacterium CG_4_10_14_0_8_um_filter_44_742]PJC35399.1 MAG: hypothetical protein CO047_05455 [Piscirickettsiaceae bacterium CG_4_9_14_0_2_um_filter_44_546]
MKTNTLKLTAGILSAGLLTGCGGIDGTTGTQLENDLNDAASSFSNYIDNITGKTKGTAITAQFIDSPVSNLQYKSNSYNEFTGANGVFSCVSGEEVEFVIGSVSLGTSICQAVITPQTLAAELKTVQTVNTTTNASGTKTSSGTIASKQAAPVLQDDDKVLNRVRLLMALDTDANPDNGITLPAVTEQAKVTATTLDFAALSFDNDVQSVLNKLQVNGSLVTKTAALTHFQKSVSGLPATYDTSTGSYDEYDENNTSNNNYENDDDHEDDDDHEGDDH